MFFFVRNNFFASHWNRKGWKSVRNTEQNVLLLLVRWIFSYLATLHMHAVVLA